MVAVGRGVATVIVGAAGRSATSGTGARASLGGAELGVTSGRGTLAGSRVVVGFSTCVEAARVGGSGRTCDCATGTGGISIDGGGGGGWLPSSRGGLTGSGWNFGGTTTGVGGVAANSGGGTWGWGTGGSSSCFGGAVGGLRGACGVVWWFGTGERTWVSGVTATLGASGVAIGGIGALRRLRAAATCPAAADFALRGAARAASPRGVGFACGLGGGLRSMRRSWMASPVGSGGGGYSCSS
jgi:hypothetical protein